MTVPSGLARQLPSFSRSAKAPIVVDREEVVAEVHQLFLAYEQALSNDDTDQMTSLFWDSPRVRRFGVADEQQGADLVRAWREAQKAHPPGRRLEATDVLALGDDHAVVTTRFGYGDEPATGRQTQVWVRLPVGWRIVSAHVSQPFSQPLI